MSWFLIGNKYYFNLDFKCRHRNVHGNVLNVKTRIQNCIVKNVTSPMIFFSENRKFILFRKEIAQIAESIYLTLENQRGYLFYTSVL